MKRSVKHAAKWLSILLAVLLMAIATVALAQKDSDEQREKWCAVKASAAIVAPGPVTCCTTPSIARAMLSSVNSSPVILIETV